MRVAPATEKALPATLAGQMPLILSGADSIVFLGIALAVLVFAINAVWRVTRSLPAMGCALVMACAAVIWLLTRFTELSLLMLFAGPLAWTAWVLWRRRAQQSAQAAPPAANAYAAWLAAQQQKQSALRPPTAAAPRPSAAPAAIRTSPTQASSAQSRSGPGQQRLADMLERLQKSAPARPMEPLPGWLARRRP